MENDSGIKQEMASKTEVSASPNHYPFEDRHAFTREKLGPLGFRVVSYNLLADFYSSMPNKCAVWD